MNKINLIFATAFAMAACTAAAAGPGGWNQPGGGGNQPGGNQPGGGGSSATWTFDTFLASSTTASGLIIRESTITGFASPAAATAASSVTQIAAGALAGCTTITSIDLSATSIAEIPDSAFAGCTALKTVTLPVSCTAIGSNAFAGCSALTAIAAEGVTHIGDDAFRGCTSLASVPSSATVFGAYAFAQSGLAKVSVDSAASVGEGAFAGCESLKAAEWSQSTLPKAVFAGCTALDQGDWSGVGEIGQAALAGIPAAALTLDPSAELSDYALAADTATLATTLANASLPAFAESAFLGREISYTPVAGSVTRIEAADLVEWLIADAGAVSPSVTQPADYNTATLEAWLATGSNAFAYAYADELANDSSFTALTVNGTSFSFTAPSNTALSIAVEPVASYSLSSDTADWSAENLVWSGDAGAYVAADTSQGACFVRLKFVFGW